MVANLRKINTRLNSYLIDFTDNPISSVAKPTTLINYRDNPVEAFDEHLFLKATQFKQKLPTIPPSPRRRINNDTTTNLRAALYVSTGLDIHLDGFHQNYGYSVERKFHDDLARLLPLNDALQPWQLKVNQALTQFRQHAQKIHENDRRNSRFAAHKGNQMLKLHGELKKLCDDFFNDYKKSKSNSAIDIKQKYHALSHAFTEKTAHANFIDDHEGNFRFYMHLLMTGIAGLGFITGAIDYGWKAATGQYFIGNQTHSRWLCDETTRVICHAPQFLR